MNIIHVICKIADAEYAIPADEAFQMETFTPATPVAGSPPYIVGLVKIRQQIIAVLDLRVRLGLPPLEPTRKFRVVALKLASRLVGILVDSARKVQNISPKEFKLAEEPSRSLTQTVNLARATEEVATRTAKTGKKTTASTESMRLVVESVATSVEETGASLESLARSQQPVGTTTAESLRDLEATASEDTRVREVALQRLPYLEDRALVPWPCGP